MWSVLFDAIKSEMAELGGYVVPSSGEEEIARNVAPPRMVLYPDGDSFEPPAGPGGNPKPIRDVWEGAFCVIHGETFDIVQGMRDQFVCALHTAVKSANQGQTGRAGEYKLAGGKWTRNTLINRNGLEYVLTFAVRASIVKRMWDRSLPAPQPPTAETYVGAQKNTYPTVPAATVQTTVDVGMRDNPPAADNPQIVVGRRP